MHPDHGETFQLSGRQQLIYGSLTEKGQELADLYVAGLRVHSDRRNPARLRLAAHSMRELVSNLPKAFDLPLQVDPGKITDQVNKLEPLWNSAFESTCHRNGEWTGNIDGPLERLLKKLHEFFEWLKENRPKHRLIVTQLFRATDPAGLPLPENLEQMRVNKWRELHRYFSNSAHGEPTGDEDFLENLDALEKILLERLYPRPSEDLSAIDDILNEGGQ